MLKNIIKKILGIFNLSISRKIKTGSLINSLGIDLILDVGANTGQYTIKSREEGYAGRVVSFEPLPYAHKQLVKNSKKDNKWEIYRRCAIGSSEKDLVINISKNSQSSSLLAMMEKHKKAAPESIYIDKVATNVISLDSIFSEIRLENEKTLLKIDVQGYEYEVLLGISSNINKIFAIELELSIVQLYENQNTYEYFFQLMDGWGYKLWSLEPVFIDPSSGQVLQFDALFIKK